MKINELISQNQEIKTILQELDNQLKTSCQKSGCPDSCRQIPTLPQRVLKQLKVIENEEEWADEVNDPDFIWDDYKQELQGELIELGGKYPTYQKRLKNLVRDLGKLRL